MHKSNGKEEKMKTTGNQESNYEKVFDQFREWFLQCPQENIAKKVGAEFDTENLYLPFFGERCRINRTTGEITGAGQRQIPVTERLTIMHHLRYCQSYAEEGRHFQRSVLLIFSGIKMRSFRHLPIYYSRIPLPSGPIRKVCRPWPRSVRKG